MNDGFVSFDAMRRRIEDVLDDAPMPEDAPPVYLVRDLRGRLRISVPEHEEEDEARRDLLQGLARRLSAVLGAHGYPPEDGVLFVSHALLDTLGDMAQPIRPGVYLADRLVTGGGWWTVGAPPAGGGRARRFTLFSVKGGVGRSTTAAILAWHLARNGERVLVVDLDLESPGLSSAMLEPGRRPDFGVTDWFVEDLVRQGDRVIESMTAAPAWAGDFEGDVRVAPAHGRNPGEYLAKLGRVYMDRHDDPWTARLERLLRRLEEEFAPTVVLLESRSGLHDIAAATVTDLEAETLLFAVDSESNWTDYGILFRHWRDRGLAGKIRERLSIVSALTPELDTPRYLERFREQAWNLFREHLYDDLASGGESGDEFSFDLGDEHAPHDPFAIHWTRGLAGGASLTSFDGTTVKQAYTWFLNRFDRFVETDDGGAPT